MSDKRTILIAGMGTSPAVLTETVWALCHGQPVQLSVHPDRLYLFNAGGLPKGWKVGRLFKKHGSEARNELIAGALYRGGFVETWGRGIEKVCRECTRLGAPNPTYEATESGVMVSIMAAYVQQEASHGPSSLETTEKTTEKALTVRERILLAIKNDPRITMAELAEKFGLTQDGVYYNIKELRAEVGLHREGGRKLGRWVIGA